MILQTTAILFTRVLQHCNLTNDRLRDRFRSLLGPFVNITQELWTREERRRRGLPGPRLAYHGNCCNFTTREHPHWPRRSDPFLRVQTSTVFYSYSRLRRAVALVTLKRQKSEKLNLSEFCKFHWTNYNGRRMEGKSDCEKINSTNRQSDVNIWTAIFSVDCCQI